MPLQIENPDSIMTSAFNVKGVPVVAGGQKKGMRGVVDIQKKRVSMSNIVASCAKKHPGIHPTMIHTVARLLNEEITQQVMMGRRCEVLGFATAYPKVTQLKEDKSKYSISLGLTISKQVRDIAKKTQIKQKLVAEDDIRPLSAIGMVSKHTDEKIGNPVRITFNKAGFELDQTNPIKFVKSSGQELNLPKEKIFRKKGKFVDFIIPETFSSSMYVIYVVIWKKSKTKTGIILKGKRELMIEHNFEVKM